MVNVNTNASPEVFDLRRAQVKRLRAAGLRVWMNQTLQLIIGEEKYAAHLRLFPSEKVIELVSENDVPTDFDDAVNKFFQAEISKPKAVKDNVADILAEVEKPKKTRAKKEEL